MPHRWHLGWGSEPSTGMMIMWVGWHIKVTPKIVPCVHCSNATGHRAGVLAGGSVEQGMKCKGRYISVSIENERAVDIVLHFKVALKR